MAGVWAVLWDLDGTLVDSERHHIAWERQVLAEVGVPLGAAEAARFLGRRTPEAFADVLTAAGAADRLDEALSAWRAGLPTHVVERVVPVRGAEAALRDLPARTFPFALVTSTPTATARAMLERFGWTWRFQALVGADDTEEGKPDPEPYLLACRRLGVEPGDALAVEDSPAGIVAARAAGCRVAAVTTTCRPDALQGAHFVLSTLGSVVALAQGLGPARRV